MRSLRVVVIGASAGGLQALDELFSAVEGGQGLAYVVVMHLSPTHESHLRERIQKRTPVPVVEAREDVDLEADHVYVIRPHSSLRFDGSRLLVRELDRGERERLSIDGALTSAAMALGPGAVAVILSGTGSDGYQGALAIKRRGGTVVAQDPATAAFESMPLSVVDNGAADLVLAPGTIVSELIQLNAVGADAYFALLSDKGRAVLSQILGAVRRTTDLSFNHYKTGTVVRRIYRRMAVLELSDPREYGARLARDEEEAWLLHHELLIGVTSFERDEGAITCLREQVLPHLLERFPGISLRLWVAGCSRGHEAYTLAMAMADAVAEEGTGRDFRIFATDVDADAVRCASEGVFSPEDAARIPEEVRLRYLRRHGEDLVVTRELRDRLLFSRHDVIEDPPFSRLHLVSCRNLLIYLKAAAQDRVLRTFANGLVDDGVLWLGSSETVGQLQDQFDTVDGTWRFYQARSGRRRNVVVPPQRTPTGITPVAPRAEEMRLIDVLAGSLSVYAPPTLVVTPGYRLVYRYGVLDDLLTVPVGHPSLDVRDMLPTEVAGRLRTAFSRLERDDHDVIHRDVVITTERGTRRFDLRVRKLAEGSGRNLYVIISFEGLAEVSAEPRALPAEKSEEEVDLLLAEARREIDDVRADLQATVEELEASNEELQSTNEELVASNEELQSTNEELQSVNEELHTVNSEHQLKVKALTEVNAKLDDILDATAIGILVLGPELEVEHFNSVAKRYFNLVDSDVGRPIIHLTHELDYPDLHTSLRDVLASGNPALRSVSGPTERTIFVAARARKLEERSVGLIVTLSDVTDEMAAEETRHQLNAALDVAGFAVAVLDVDGKVVGFNRTFAELFRRDPAHLAGKSILDMCEEGRERDNQKRGLQQCSAKLSWRGIVRSRLPQGDPFWEVVDLIGGSRGGDGSVTILRLSRRLSALFPRGFDWPSDGSRKEHWLWNPNTDHAYFTQGLGALWGVDDEEVSMAGLSERLDEKAREAMLSAIERALESGKSETVQVRVARPDGPVVLETTMQRRGNEGAGYELIGQTETVSTEGGQVETGAR